MDIVTLDFESYYGADYTLTKLTTEEYVRDARFETILCGFKINGGKSWWVPRDDVQRQLVDLHLEKRAVLAHHAHFDGLILSHRYDIRPAVWLDTLGMARALHGANGRLSLAKLAERYGIGEKGGEVLLAKDMHYADFTPQQLERYGQYCCNDSDLCYDLALRMMPRFGRSELQIYDQIIRMFTEPVFDMDIEMLEQYAGTIAAEKMALMLEAGVQKKDLMSNAKFAQELIALGIDPPMKVSPSWLKKPPEERERDKMLVYAFAKTDHGMQALQEHPDERVQVLVEARLKNKTTIAEKGANRLVAMSRRGPATVYLKVAGASGTHRLSGGDKFNWQSMKRASKDEVKLGRPALRRAVRAPAGHVVVVCDSSTIEARMLDWLAGQEDMVEVYRKADAGTGPDMYCVIAGYIYECVITKATHPDERQMGKVCVAEGTPVLTGRGWVPIEQVGITDLIWDGDAWQRHSGLSPNGLKQTLSLSGLWLTPDHLVWCGTQWKEAQYLEGDANLHSQALAFAAASLPSLDIYAASEVASAPSSCSVAAGDRSTPSIPVPSSLSVVDGAPPAVMKQPQRSVTGNTTMCCLIQRIALGFSIGLAQRLHDVITRTTQGMRAMAAGVFRYASNGELIGPHSYSTYKPALVGMTPSSIWIEKKPTVTTNPAISGSLLAPRMPETNDALIPCRRKLPVYDLLSCGPKNRFTVMSGAGPVIVHNCKLGLGFGMGVDKFVISVRGQAKGPDGKPLVLTKEFGTRVVTIYRDTHPQVRKLWKRGDEVLKAIAAGQIGVPLDYQGVVKTCKDGLVMPGGLQILFPELNYKTFSKGEREANNGYFDGEWTFWNGKAREHIYGSKLIENVIQCLARIVVFNQCLEAAKLTRGIARWAHSVHDEGVFVTHAWYGSYVLDILMKSFRTPPDWAHSLPLNCEGGFHRRYGDAKQ